MRHLLMRAICTLFVGAMVLGSVVLGQPTPALASPAIALPPTVSVQSLNTADGWLIAQTSDPEEVPEDVLKGLPTGATLDEEDPTGRCTKEGFFSNPSDQRKFRRCVYNPTFNSFTEYGFDCAPGTDLWCQEILTCSFNFQCPSTSGN